jgi:putative Holliday junction resolvase
MRILAMDVGEKTIGLALSDALGLTARPLRTIRRRSYKADLAEIEKVIDEWQVGRIVLGYPLHASGQAGDAVLRVERLADKLKKRFELPMAGVDERYSTLEAMEMKHSPDHAARRKSFDKDAVAAALILKRFLEEVDSAVCKEW